MFYSLKAKYRSLKQFLRAAWRFRKELSDCTGWDYSELYNLMIKQLELMIEKHESPHAWAVGSERKAKEMRIAKKCLERILEDDYGVNELFSKIYNKYNKEKNWTFNLHFTKEEDKQLERARKKAKELKKQDFMLFCKLFKKSEGWWD